MVIVIVVLWLPSFGNDFSFFFWCTVGDSDSLSMSPSAPHWLKEVERDDKKMLTGKSCHGNMFINKLISEQHGSVDFLYTNCKHVFKTIEHGNE